MLAGIFGLLNHSEKAKSSPSLSLASLVHGESRFTSAILKRVRMRAKVAGKNLQCAPLLLTTTLVFTITAEIHARSVANFYCQYADRHMNEPAIRPFVIVKNKLMSVFNESVLLLIMNFVITLSK